MVIKPEAGYVRYMEMPVDDIKAGKFKVPAIKKLVEEAEKPQTSDDGFMKIPLDADEETPFN